MAEVSDEPVQVDVRRSARRRKTVSAYRDGNTVVVMIPARMSRAEEAHWVQTMVARLEHRRVPRAARSDADLVRHLRRLAAAHLPPGFLDPDAALTARWVTTMRQRWASCTPADRTIRVSDRLRTMPAYVRDYVLVHELAHLREPGHGPGFWALVERYPATERARGFLEGVSAASGLDLSDVDDEVGDGLTDGRYQVQNERETGTG